MDGQIDIREIADLRQLKDAPRVIGLLARFPVCELPGDRDVVTAHLLVPSIGGCNTQDRQPGWTKGRHRVPGSPSYRWDPDGRHTGASLKLRTDKNKTCGIHVSFLWDWATLSPCVSGFLQPRQKSI
jgi:hypothetical protein